MCVCYHQTWTSMKDPVLHIELRRWADVMVIAPLDANTLAKISSGICDNLLVSAYYYYYYCIYTFIYLSKSTQSATGLKALKLAANGCYLKLMTVQIIALLFTFTVQNLSSCQ